MTTADEVIAKYDEIVRANYAPDWDTLAAVATCDDGMYGAWGEVLDTAVEMAYPTDLAAYKALRAAFADYQTGLRAGLGLGGPS